MHTPRSRETDEWEIILSLACLQALRLGNLCDSILMAKQCFRVNGHIILPAVLYFATSSLRMLKIPYKSLPFHLAHCCLSSHSEAATIMFFSPINLLVRFVAWCGFVVFLGSTCQDALVLG